MQKGNIGVTTENIFPIIKKFLYSDPLHLKVNSKERWEILPLK